MARKFLLVMAVLIGLVILGAVVLTVFEEELMQAYLVPSDPFSQEAIPPAPDYTSAQAWAAGASSAATPADLRPDGVTYKAPRDVAIFYLHPTSYWAKDNWNGPVDDAAAIKRLNEFFLGGQASAFAPYGTLYAPYYRQAAIGAFLAQDENMMKAVQVAYGDASRAFENFLERIGPDKSFILVGHSQGALHLLTMLHTHIQPRGLQGRMVAAYLIGWPISAEADLPATIPACTAPDQTSCVITWQTFGPDGDSSQMEALFAASPSFTGQSKAGEPMLCVNPLSFTTQSEAVGAAQNLGAVAMPGASGTLKTPEAGLVGARCGGNGILYLDRRPEGAFDQYVLPGDNFHMQDVQLFYRNIQANLETRLNAYEGQ